MKYPFSLTNFSAISMAPKGQLLSDSSDLLSLCVSGVRHPVDPAYPHQPF